MSSDAFAAAAFFRLRKHVCLCYPGIARVVEQQNLELHCFFAWFSNSNMCILAAIIFGTPQLSSDTFEAALGVSS